MNNPNLNVTMPQGLSRVRIAVGVVVAFLFLSHLEDLAGGLLTASVALVYARLRRWPEVKFRYYFSTLKLALPGCAFVAGASAQVALFSLDQPGLGIGAALAAAVAVAALILILEGKVMKNIFDLVPTDQQDQLDDFLGAKAPQGQRADFSHLDPVRVEGFLRDRVIGQNSVVHECVQTAFRRVRLARSNKPVMTALFVGATGAGKTELAKALAAELFAGRMIRVDCNELSAEHGVQRLIGAPPGYAGSEDGGQLCRAIGRFGTGLILLDEIEKAHPVVLKTVMGLLDEARLTEQSTGQVYDASGFMIVLTSNAKQAEIGKIAAATADSSERTRKVKDELKSSGFLPEVLARLDAIFPFEPLSRRALAAIVGRFLMGIAGEAGVEVVSVDAELLIDLVAKAEKLSDYGVREVVRAVESAVVDQLLDLKDRGVSHVAIRVENSRVVVHPATRAVAI
ncbi:hypothetical protein HDE76_003860 [Rhodanobacter sp. ANJX3]|uniref:AAA family ATPase n=1 Tax=Rhodanobacter sp. ANJX3 TaxID=2723083 RepID=UPI00160D9185|nr:AAA family ATPase [Rhodanobacter sp. ANJX3]MBB5360615.1 hypothetical protein [Rhodanobacter sp. ANJX3]